MPKIDELLGKSKKKFKKSIYRPWNYMEEVEKEEVEENKEIRQESSEKKSKFSLDSKNSKSKESYLEANETALDKIFRLTGHQKKIFLFIIEKCMSRGLLETGIIKREILVNLTKTTSKMVNTSVQRLLNKELIKREKGKTGRGGFCNFRISEVVRNAAIEYRRMVGIDTKLKLSSKSNKNPSKRDKLNNESSLKSSLLPKEWKSINIEPLSDIGFTSSHLEDIAEPGLADPKVVQESILHLAYGLENEPKNYTRYENILNVFIGRLRKGKGWIEKNYKTAKEIAQKKFIEQKMLEKERLKKLEEEAYDLALKEWKLALSQGEKITILELEDKKKGGIFSVPQKVKLSLYFRDNIWPAKKKDYLVGV